MSVVDTNALTMPVECDGRSARLPFSEIYNGNSDDETPERVRIRGTSEADWSIMRSGGDSNSRIEHNGGRYHAFSIEELPTIEI